MIMVFFSFGFNIDCEYNIGLGLDDLVVVFGELCLSLVYESEVVGFKGSFFFNLVVVLDIDLLVVELVDWLCDIECVYGWVCGEKKFVSCILDIDIFIYGECIGEIDGVSLFCDEIFKYVFVLWLLVDLVLQVMYFQFGCIYVVLFDEYWFLEQCFWQVLFVWF